jgi:hypothetical protein
MAAVLCGSLMFLATGGVACFAADMTSGSLDQVWGKPVDVVKLDNVAEKRIYNMPDTYKAMGVGYKYFIVKNGTVVKEGVTNDLDRKIAAKKALASIPMGKLALSKSYFETHPTTVADIDRVWGKPADVRKLANGLEERFYPTNIEGVKSQYRNFICKDGRVIASGLTYLSDGKASSEPTNLIGLGKLNVYRGTESSYH